MELEEALLEVWRQALLQEKKTVELEGEKFPVGRTRKQKLRTVDFRVGGLAVTGIEQNPATGSVWAARARRGARIMQFSHQPHQWRGQGRYIGNVCDARLTRYAAWPASPGK